MSKQEQYGVLPSGDFFQNKILLSTRVDGILAINSIQINLADDSATVIAQEHKSYDGQIFDEAREQLFQNKETSSQLKNSLSLKGGGDYNSEAPSVPDSCKYRKIR